MIGLNPPKHLVKRPRLADNVMVLVTDSGPIEILLRTDAMRTGLLAEQMVSLYPRLADMGFDDRFGKEAAVERMSWADQPALDHDNGRMPSSRRQRTPPFGEPFACVQLNRNPLQLARECVLDHVHGQRAFAARDLDTERAPLAGPAIESYTYGVLKTWEQASLCNRKRDGPIKGYDTVSLETYIR